jgi:hypothetical protein
MNLFYINETLKVLNNDKAIPRHCKFKVLNSQKNAYHFNLNADDKSDLHH